MTKSRRRRSHAEPEVQDSSPEAANDAEDGSPSQDRSAADDVGPEETATVPTPPVGGAGAEATEDAAFYIDRLQRLQAEFDNYRRRSQQELREREKRTVARIFERVLPIVDDLRSAAQVEEERAPGVSEGLRIILEKVKRLLEEFSIEEIPAVGEPFDPRWHEAMLHQEHSEATPGAVIDELERGYRLGDQLVRPARVIVAKEPTSNGTAAEDATDADV